ncbi:neuropeptide CCHamide-2 receptor-like [Homalodisca vitripennis]|uniref:neuropeptide CCHamide-2 receptor-like n=1 Tax=Homalodisca vitripennis TaxID=197043 RepID=UPI001EEBD0DA|nr:neuropeptide CCHamide-2 receptor-like [Homalodisca vitripennis]
MLQMEITNISEGLVTDTAMNDKSTSSEFVETFWMRFHTYMVHVVFGIILGFVGNGTVILIFLRHRNMRSIPNIYIFSLALGDLLAIISCIPFILHAYTYVSWPWGEFIYKICETCKELSIGVSVFTLTALSVERYYAIVHPMNQKMSTKRFAIRMALAIWVISIALAIPAGVFSKCEQFFITVEDPLYICFPFPSREHAKFVITLRLLIYYLIPIVMIGFYYSLMARHLVLSTGRFPQQHGQGQLTQMLTRKKVAVMALAFVIIFMICFFPMRISMLWFFYNPDWAVDYSVFWYYFHIIGFHMGYFYFCVNPIALYFTKSYRKYFNYYLFRCSYGTLDKSDLIQTRHC